MQLAQLLFVFVVLVARSLSEIRIELNEPGELEELEEAAIQILTTCYTNQTKTIALAGDYSSSFMKRLSLHESFALASLSSRIRSKNNIDMLTGIDKQSTHKVDIVVAMAPHHNRFRKVLTKFWYSLYDNPMALTILLVWSPHEKDAGCDGEYKTANFFYPSNMNNHLNTILMCHNRNNGIMMYGSNPFKNYAPEPWQSVPFEKPIRDRYFHYFVRTYRINEEMCKNLEFDKTRNLNGWPIKVAWDKKVVRHKNEIDLEWDSNRDIRLLEQHTFGMINSFISYVNGSVVIGMWDIQQSYVEDWDKYEISRNPIRAFQEVPLHHAYPSSRIVTFLVSQFRGNKSQLRKILGVIDEYSWIGMFFVYLITLLFFKYSLREPLSSGILNLCRLTCNCGITTSTRNGAQQIYLTGLLFFVVTMQGIFTGNLASLLTHDFPVQQVNSIQDVIDLDYTVYCDPADVILFDDPRFKGRIITTEYNANCIEEVKLDARGVCTVMHVVAKYLALQSNLYVGTEVIDEEWGASIVPWRWSLLERFNAFQGILTSAGAASPFQTMVDRKRLDELEAIEIELEPEVMIWENLGFAFVILAIGLVCATITFIGELIIHWYYRRVSTTRVIVLKRQSANCKNLRSQLNCRSA